MTISVLSVTFYLSDINECAINQSLCTKENEMCFNAPGSYECRCAIGFATQGGSCKGLFGSELTFVQKQL